MGYPFFPTEKVSKVTFIHTIFLANHFFLLNYELKTPSVEMACLLGIQNKIQAVCVETK